MEASAFDKTSANCYPVGMTRMILLAFLLVGVSAFAEHLTRTADGFVGTDLRITRSADGYLIHRQGEVRRIYRTAGGFVEPAARKGDVRAAFHKP